MAESVAQTVPVRVYQGDGRIMVAAPLPGLEAGDIVVTVAGDTITIRGAARRGARQDEREVLVSEWRVGPYYREFRLARAVDGARTNATYGNGVLVLAMPKRVAGQDGTDGEFRLEVLAATRGEHAGHAGRDHHPTSTADRLRQQEEAVRSAAGR
jgi:HSP20 family protein